MPRAATTTDPFNAIAEPRRRQLIELLAAAGGRPRAVGEMVELLGLPQPAVSKHLGVLRKVGLVTVSKQGQRRLYELNAQELKPDLCSKYLKAVAEPDRLRIVQTLRDGPRSVGEIARLLRTPLANASHHLKALRRAGLVATSKQGRFVIYSLAARFARSGGTGPSLDVLDFGCCRIELTAKEAAARRE